MIPNFWCSEYYVIFFSTLKQFAETPILGRKLGSNEYINLNSNLEMTLITMYTIFKWIWMIIKKTSSTQIDDELKSRDNLWTP